jgi:hypothetical protein
MADPLLEPYQLRHLTIRNRIISTAHAPNLVEDGHPRDRYRLYHEEKAKGGIGLTMVGGSTNIAPDSPSVFGQLYAGDDSIVPWFRRLTEGVKSYGAAIMCQITHMGRRTAWDDGHWLPVIGPSGRRERAHRAFPKVMEREDIARVVGDFAAAARRCQEGGFDGIELLSHSHLLGQFLSPLVNDRQDDFGGSLENRLRLTLEVLKAVRAAVGPEMILGIRMTGDELEEAGLSADDCVAVARMLADTGQVDFLNILAGAPYDDLGLAGWVPPMGMPSAPHLPIVGRIRQATGLPVIHAGGIADLATARHAVSEGHLDLVGMTRAHIADPHLVAKLMRGEEDRIRPCVGLGACVDRVNQGKPAVCGHNAATGREAVMPHVIAPADTRRKVVVVGGGPGGLEAARVSALRGHEVVLMEAADRLGGQLLLACKGRVRRQVRGVADWLIAEVDRLGVETRLTYYAEAADVLAEAPDMVIIATGGWPDPPAIPGGDLTLSSWDVLAGGARPTGAVLLMDESGDQPGAVTVDALTEMGCAVELVTPDRSPLHDLGPTTSAVALRQLARDRVRMTCLHELTRVEVDGPTRIATLCHVLTGQTVTRRVDHVVVEHGLTPSDALYHALKQGSSNLGQLDHAAMIAGTDPFKQLNPQGRYRLARIGDAVAGRNIHAAVYDALRVCKSL